MKVDRKRELFKDFLQKNTVLLADTSSASRRRLVKTLVDMGCKRQNVFSVAHYSEALEIIKNEKPKLVLSEFSLLGGSGFDLFKAYRNQEKRLSETTLILVTSNISQAAVAKAAEEDVDSFIIKPYTVKSLEKSLVTAVINKLYPNKYMLAIDEGKQALFAGDYEKACEIFERAAGMAKQPSLAWFYKGQAEYFLKKSEEAKGDYQTGLKINSIHYKCQAGLFDLFMQEQKWFEAYEVARNLSKYFPSNPERLKQVVRLSVMTENYEHLAEYYDVFTGLEERPEDVVNYMCSGLYVLGRFMFFKGEKRGGKETFEKVAISCMGQTKFLNALVKKYVEEKMHTEALDLLKRYPREERNQSGFLVSSYLAKSNQMSVTERVSGGLELFNNGHKDPMAMKVLLQALISVGSQEKAKQYFEEAQFEWPDIFKDSKILGLPKTLAKDTVKTN